jgi:hypothetical protein
MKAIADKKTICHLSVDIGYLLIVRDRVGTICVSGRVEHARSSTKVRFNPPADLIGTGLNQQMSNDK